MKRNPIPTIDDTCEVCGRPYAELHEVFFGTGQRQKSIEHGMQIRLCAEHHRGKNGPHINKEADNELKQMFQKKFENMMMEQGLNESEARGVFMQEFGRNYLE